VLIENLVTKSLETLDASSVVREANFELTNRAKTLSDLIATSQSQVAEPFGHRIAVPPWAFPERQELRTGRSIKMHVCAAIRRSNFAYSVGYGNCNVCFTFPIAGYSIICLGFYGSRLNQFDLIASLARTERHFDTRRSVV